MSRSDRGRRVASGAGATLGVALALPAAVAAQQSLPPPGGATVVDPATILEQERRRQQQLARPPVPERAPAVIDDRPVATATDTALQTRFVLRAVRFSDSALLPSDALQAAVAPFVGRTLDFAGLGEVVEAVNRLYLKRGIYTGRAILPPQTVRDGVVEIRLVEGRIGAVKVTGVDARRRAYVERRVRAPADSIADVHALEDELVRFNATQDTQLRASLQPGSAFGRTDVLLAATPPRRFQLDLLGDNNGYASTGHFQGGAAVRAYDVLGLGDRVAASALASGGLASGSLSYSRPLDTRGTRLAVSGSYGGSRVVAGPYRALGVEGRSATGALNLSRPLVTTGHWTLLAALSGQFTSTTTDVADTRVSDARIWTADAGLTVNYIGGRVAAVAQATVGPAFTDERLLDLRRSLLVTRGSAFVSYQPSAAIRLRARADWQYIKQRDVIGTLEYQIGGAQSARGFQSGAAAGDSGYYAALEAGHPVVVGRSGGEVYAFVDRAQIFSNFPGVHLMSAGIGATATALRRLTIGMTVAKPIGDNLPIRPAGVRALASVTLHVL